MCARVCSRPETACTHVAQHKGCLWKRQGEASGDRSWAGGWRRVRAIDSAAARCGSCTRWRRWRRSVSRGPPQPRRTWPRAVRLPDSHSVGRAATLGTRPARKPATARRRTVACGPGALSPGLRAPCDHTGRACCADSAVRGRGGGRGVGLARVRQTRSRIDQRVGSPRSIASLVGGRSKSSVAPGGGVGGGHRSGVVCAVWVC